METLDALHGINPKYQISWQVTLSQIILVSLFSVYNCSFILVESILDILNNIAISNSVEKKSQGYQKSNCIFDSRMIILWNSRGLTVVYNPQIWNGCNRKRFISLIFLHFDNMYIKTTPFVNMVQFQWWCHG